MAIGITGAVLVSRFLRAILFDVSATDGLSHPISSAMLLIAALLACYVPIRSLALKVDPKSFLGRAHAGIKPAATKFNMHASGP